MLIINDKLVRRILSMAEAIEGVREAFVAISSGKVQMPLRTNLSLMDRAGSYLVMPAFVQGRNQESLAVKVLSVFPQNPKDGFSAIQGALLLFEPTRGIPLAVIGGGALTALRTGAASGLATDLLARPDSHVLVLFGAGVQARTLLEAVCTVRKISKVWVCGRSGTPSPSIERFIHEISGQAHLPLDVEFAPDHHLALSEADILCTATNSHFPVFLDTDLPTGVHLNAIGSHRPTEHEIPIETIVRSKLFVESRSAALKEAGEICIPIQQGLVSESHITAELGELVLHPQKGRTSSEEITLFKSVGVAAQDAVVAQLVYNKALQMGLGQTVNW